MRATGLERSIRALHSFCTRTSVTASHAVCGSLWDLRRHFYFLSQDRRCSVIVSVSTHTVGAYGRWGMIPHTS